MMKRLPYLDALVNESHRLKSVAPFLFMQPLEPVTVAEIELEPSHVVALLTREGALRASAFTEPESFCPERWLRDDPSLVERFPIHEPKTVLAFGLRFRLLTAYCRGRMSNTFCHE
ncbi:MAG: cytochrome P450 [Nannocystaceae bacterium]